VYRDAALPFLQVNKKYVALFKNYVSLLLTPENPIGSLRLFTDLILSAAHGPGVDSASTVPGVSQAG
jgi:hypothetical protein